MQNKKGDDKLIADTPGMGDPALTILLQNLKLEIACRFCIIVCTSRCGLFLNIRKHFHAKSLFHYGDLASFKTCLCSCHKYQGVSRKEAVE
jgi:hypothetical protein